MIEYFTSTSLGSQPPSPGAAVVVASGDMRLAANQDGWPAQQDMETRLVQAFAAEGTKLIRAHLYDPKERHGFISSQRIGMDVFARIPPDAPVVVAEAVWQYSHHLLAGLRDHRGPILTIGNWNGQNPGLVGLLNLNASLTKMGVPYSTIWSEDFEDGFFRSGIRQWLAQRTIVHDSSHVRGLAAVRLPAEMDTLGRQLAERLRRSKAILGVFDEGCMGMYNAIIEDDLLNPLGLYKERLSQSALLAEMREVSLREAQAARAWLDERGFTFLTGPDEAADLTDGQVLEQLRMYIAAVRMADRFSCEAIGIQYQQGLKDMAPASDLAEGLLNNVERPPVFALDGERELYPGSALPHFNEVDECAGVDALITHRVWTALNLDPATTLHDIRWGAYHPVHGRDEFVWVLMISGATPASHLEGGYARAVSERQPAKYFPLGGGTLKGVGRPGELVWSRVFVQAGKLRADLGRATAVRLPPDEVQRRWRGTTPQWPMLNAVLRGVTRDQMMARHKANHLNVAYAPTAAIAAGALAAKAAMLDELGIDVHLCGDVGL
jgi:hypothetical protein